MATRVYNFGHSRGHASPSERAAGLSYSIRQRLNIYPRSHLVPQVNLLNRSHAGFTLVELLVVMVLIGLLAGLTMARLGGVTNPARLQAAVERVAALDATTRHNASQHARPATLRLDFDQNRLERLEVRESRASRTVELGNSVQLTRVLTTTRDAGNGQVSIDYSSRGTSETFALELTATDGRTVWLVFAGTTGQMSQWENRRDVEEILETLRAAGVDAD